MARQQFHKKHDRENSRKARLLEKNLKKQERMRDVQKEELRKQKHGSLFKPILRNINYGGHR